MIRSTLFVGAVAVSGAISQAAIVEHVGANDPTTEATPWAYDVLGTNSVGPIINDAGSGYDAWQVDDNASGGYAWYLHSFTAGELAAMSGQNWIAGMRMRQPGTSTAADGDVLMDVHYGTKRFLIYFGTQADNDPTWDLDGVAGPALAAIPDLGGGYHLYEVRYDATTTLADFYVDGQLAYDDWAGSAVGSPQRIAFGSAAGGPTDSANYNLVTVTLDPIPEPAALSLLAMGALAGLRRRSR